MQSKINFYCHCVRMKRHAPITTHSAISEIGDASCLNPSLLHNPFIRDVHAYELNSGVEINTTRR